MFNVSTLSLMVIFYKDFLLGAFTAKVTSFMTYVTYFLSELSWRISSIYYCMSLGEMITFNYFVCVFTCVCVSILLLHMEGMWTACKNRSFPSPLWVLGMTASVFTYRAISLAPRCPFKDFHLIFISWTMFAQSHTHVRCLANDFQIKFYIDFYLCWKQKKIGHY